MNTFVFDRSDARIMLWHMALYGLGAILEQAGLSDVRLSWTPGMEPRARIDAADVTGDQIAEVVWDHTRHHATPPSWMLADITLKGTPRAAMSPRITPFENDQIRHQAQHARHTELDALTNERAWLDLRMLAALGEPCYWSHNPKGEPLQDDGASRLEMQPRNQGSEFVGSRLRKLAQTVTARELPAIKDGLVGDRVQDEAGGDSLASRTATGFANPGPTDNAVAWCALWGISQLPIAPRVNHTAITSGHLGKVRQESFHLPFWTTPWRPARLRDHPGIPPAAYRGNSWAAQRSGRGRPYPRRPVLAE
jgi:CRISPR-associated protein Csb3